MNKRHFKHQFEPRTCSGFSLMELMIAVAIVGIVSMIAYPSYQSYLVDSKRSVAQSDLMAFAAQFERHKLANFSYAGAGINANDTGSPAVFANHSPSSEPAGSKAYNLTIDSLSLGGTAYRIKAQPVLESQGALYYYSDGRKAWDQNADGSLSPGEFCWRC
ncbi:type IV pilin protein [Paraglaciecola sp. 20A4]|uniref:type IV pilin protein n=1 Tax=Paraglaciecola sp. 20A4 TaxID=2687288 RepID=UPI001409FDE8|nr:type IV pilin protein [Paraglaciecola sp. 20A4]